MEIIYAIYKENIIPMIGGVNPNGIEIGLAQYKGWKLCAMKTDEFTQFSEFNLYPIPKSIAVGMVLQGKTKTIIPSTNGPGDTMPVEIKKTLLPLTNDEKILVDLAVSYLTKLELKFITRAKIRAFKDFEDDLSDTKLLVEFLLGYIAEDFNSKSTEEKELYPIKDLMTSFVTALEGKNLRINNDNILGKISKIISDESFISKIVKSSYIDQLKNIAS